MSKEAMKLALEALKADQKLIEAYRPKSHTDRLLNAIKALEEALAKQEQGEPVAEYIGNNPDELDLSKRIGLIHRLKFIPLRSKLYITPQQRTWVGLTDDEIYQVMQDRTWMHTEGLCRAIEAKLKDKNI